MWGGNKIDYYLELILIGSKWGSLNVSQFCLIQELIFTAGAQSFEERRSL